MVSPRQDPHQLALKAFAKGDLTTAERLYGRLLRDFPQDFNALHMLGVIRAQQGKFLEADRLIARALQFGRSPEALSNHGNVLAELERHDEAIRQLRHSLLIRPGSPETLFNLGNALVKMQRWDEAADAFAGALAGQPDFVAALQNYGDLLREMGRYPEAITLLRRAVALSPADADVQIALGLALQESGELEAAGPVFDTALAQDPAAAAAYYHRVKMTRIAPGDAILARMESLAAEPGKLTPENRAMLGFALAKAYEDIGRYDESFSLLLEANRLVKSAIGYDESVSARRFERVRAAFTAGLLARRSAEGSQSALPIFVLGFPRSGTTLTEQILASHPEVHGSGENSYLEDLASSETLTLPDATAPSGRIAFPESLAQLPAERLRQAGDLYARRLGRIAPQVPHVTDKLPANFLFVGFIHLILPRARIIHVKRDAMDTCVSCFAQRFRGNNVGFSYDLGTLGRHYRLYRDLMAHWRQVMAADSMLEVQYEDLVDDLEGQARRIVQFCGLAWDERCLSFHQTERAVRTASVSQVRQPIYRSSLQRWRRYEKYLGPLIEALGEMPAAAGAATRA
jgi:tetratricopeptide (TPR) repeat protein